MLKFSNSVNTRFGHPGTKWVFLKLPLQSVVYPRMCWALIRSILGVNKDACNHNMKWTSIRRRSSLEEILNDLTTERYGPIYLICSESFIWEMREITNLSADNTTFVRPPLPRASHSSFLNHHLHSHLLKALEQAHRISKDLVPIFKMIHISYH